MSCYHPLRAVRSSEGKRPLIIKKNDPWPSVPKERRMKLSCGQCIGCRLERSRKWAYRCVHEAQMHENNSFITLTFNDKHLASDKSLHTEDFQKFMKRLRQNALREYGINGIRFYHCGEYGEVCEWCGLSYGLCKKQGCGCFKASIGRPHHHACLFGMHFPDKKIYKVEKVKNKTIKLYQSDFLDDCWQHQGYATIGDVTFESAAYVARYIMKKLNGEQGEAWYKGRKPEYTTMSRNRGIGAEWIKKFHADVYSDDMVVLKGGIKCRPPAYYDSIYDEINHEKMEKIKENRLQNAMDNADSIEHTRKRREQVEKCRMSGLVKLKRRYEDGTNDV